MTTANGTMNARTARKSLSDQLDRFDAMLDGLSEAIPQVIADSVREAVAEAVRQAVEASIREVLSRPELLRAALEKHAPTATLFVPPATPEPPPMKEKVAGIASRLCEKVKQAASLVKEKVTEVCTSACQVGKQAAQIAVNAPTLIKAIAKAAWALRKPCAIAVGVGVVCATVCYMGGQIFSSIANGASGAAITLSALTLPLKRLFWGGSR